MPEQATDAFDVLEKFGAPKPPADDPFEMMENPTRAVHEVVVPKYLKNMVAAEKSWKDVEPEVKKFGVDPERYRQDYQLAEAHAVQKGEGVGTIEQLGRQGLPFASSVIRQTLANRYTDAMKRYREGKMTGEDAGTIARYERLQGIDQQTGSTFGGKLVQALGGAGEIIGEAGLAGGVAAKVPGLGGVGVGRFLGRQAVATPLMPSLYQQHAAETNIQEGRSASDIRALPTALGLAYANNLVLGQLQGVAKAIPGGLIPRAIGAGAVGVGEQAGVNFAGGLADEVLPKAFQTRTKYGTIGQLAGLGGQKANVSEGLQHAAVELLTFSLFAGFHGGPKSAEKAIESGQKVLEESHAAGEPPEVAAAKLTEHVAAEQAKLPPPEKGATVAPPEPPAGPIHPLDTISKEQLKQVAEGLGATQKELRAILADPKQAQMVVDAVLGEQKPAENAPEARPGALPEAGPTPGSVPEVAVAAKPEPQPVVNAPSRGSVKIGPGEPGGKRMDGQALTRHAMLDDAGKEIGHAKVFESGKTLHIDWLGMEGAGATDTAAKGSAGARQIMQAITKLAEAYPNAEVAKYTPAAGRLNPGATKYIDLVKIRERGGRVDQGQSGSVPEQPPPPRKDVLLGRLRSEQAARGATIAPPSQYPGQKPPDQANVLLLRAGGQARGLRNRKAMMEVDKPAPRTEGPSLANPTEIEDLHGNALRARILTTRAITSEAMADPTPENIARAKASVKGTQNYARSRGLDPGLKVTEHFPKWAEFLAKPKPKLTPEQLAKVRMKNLVKPKTLAGQLEAEGGINAASAESVGLDVKSLKEGPLKKLFKRDGGRHIEDIVPELQRSGDLPQDSAGQHLPDVLMERLQSGAAMADMNKAEDVHEKQYQDWIKQQMAEEAGQGVNRVKENLRRTDGKSESEIAAILEALGRKAGRQAQEESAQVSRPGDQPAGDRDAESAKPAEPSPDAERGPDDSALPPGADDFGFGANSGVRHAGFPYPARIMNALSRAVFGKGRGKDPNFAVDPDPNPDNPRALPDFKTATRAAYNQLGARNSTPMQIATTAWAWMKHTADQLANAWLISHGHKPDAFKANPKMSDVIEAEIRTPGSQKLNPAESAQVALWQGVWEKQLRAMKAAGVKEFRDNNGNIRTVDEMLKEGYFPRPVKEETAVGSAWASLFGRKNTGVNLTSTGKPGITPGYRKARVFATEEAGRMAGTKYKESFYERVADFIRSTNREIADTRLANDPKLGGVDTIAPARAALFAKNSAVLKALPAPERALLVRQLAMLASQTATGNVMVAPAFRGKEYSAEVKKHLEAMYGERAGPILKLAGAMSQEVRNLVLGGDMSYALLQMQSMFFTNPGRWAKSMAAGVNAIFKPDVLSKYAEIPENRQALDEVTQAGGTAGTMPEQISSLGGGQSLVSKVPVLGKVYDRLGRAMSTALDVAKLELWKANRPADPKQWPRAVEALENSLGQGRMEQLGMTPERAFLERLTFLAPSYYRAHLKLLEQATQGGQPGFIARKQLGSLAAGVMLTSIAALYALKKTGQISDEEMEERLNPARGKFLMIPVKLGESGKTVEIGFGGVYVSIARTIGNAQRYAEGKASDNPYIHWYRGHAGVAIRAAWDIGTGKDYLGKPVEPGEALAKSVLPVAAQQGFTGEGTAGQHAADVGAGLLGLRSYPGSDAGNHLDKLRKAAMEKTGKRYEDLSIPEQARIVKEVGEEKPASTEGAKLRAIEADELKVKRLTKLVSGDTQKALKEFSHALPSYDTKLAMHGIGIPLTGARQDRFEKLLAEEYDKSVAAWPVDRLRDAPPKSRETFMMHSLELAKTRAKSRLIHESAGR